RCQPGGQESAPALTESAVVGSCAGRESPPPSLESGVESIAVIGMSGRFPGARTVDEMWAVLEEGRDAVVRLSDLQARLRDGSRVEGMGTGRLTSLGAIDGVAEFDSLFFEISPREAQSMDPRQRLLLQESWNALEDAGCTASSLRGRKVGMFVGVESGEYAQL